MLKVSLWKLILCIVVFILSLIFSIPTFLSDDNPMAEYLPSKKVNLGLDLRGGAYLLLEMKLDQFDKDYVEKFMDQIRIGARSSKLKLNDVKQVSQDTIMVEAPEGTDVEALTKMLKSATSWQFDVSHSQNRWTLVQNKDKAVELHKDLLTQTIEIVRRRVDESGTREIDLQRQGDNYILLQVPGIDDPNEIKRLLGKTAKLSFHMVAEDPNSASVKSLPIQDTRSGSIKMMPIESRAMLTGDMLIDAQTNIHDGKPVVAFKFNQLGAKIMGEASSKGVGKMMAIILDNVIISAPVFQEPILSGNGQISGNFTVESANELSLLLRAGALPVPLEIVEERSVGPSLGSDSIESGTKAAVVGCIMVLIFMFIFYYWYGMVANVALVLNLFMILAVLAMFNATLTLSGIAGIVLTLGMAVDANVLIFERIREELKKGRTPFSAMESGYEMAFGTILDSNVTTVLAGVILYIFSTGLVKGFAVTLIVGVLCSMFTAVTVTKVIFSLWFRKYKPTSLNI